MKISYNWLRDLVPLTLGPKELAERLTMAGLAVESIEEHGEDRVLDVDLTSNRPDALCHLGVAREAAVLCQTELIERKPSLKEIDQAAESVASVEILDPDLCPRYAARIVKGVKVGPSPKWLIDRLEAVGQRSVNNIADITNYVMFEMGQPTHAFDLNLLSDRKIIVRKALPGEKLTTLDGMNRELSPEMLMIADARRVVAVAGVMGGEESEISSITTDVLIESAYFKPSAVRTTSRLLGLDTEASYRFSRGADPDGQVRAAGRVAELIAEIAGGQILRGALDAHPLKITSSPLRLREARVEQLTGLQVAIDESAAILRRLGFKVEVDSGTRSLTANAPSFRVDIAREEDLVEEVARHVGYDKVGITLPAWKGQGRYLPNETQRRSIRTILAALGFNEAISFSFVNGERDRLFRREGERQITLANPIDVNESEMRVSILTGLLGALQHNFNHGSRDVKLFEIGRVFREADSGERPDEREMLGIVISGSLVPDDWRGARQVDFHDLKGITESVLNALNLSGFTTERASVEYLHPGQSAVLKREGAELVRIGRLHPRVASVYKFRQPVFVAEVEFERLCGLQPDAVKYRQLPRHPDVSRDVSLLVPEATLWNDIEEGIRRLAIEEIESIRVFDTYRGKGIPEGMRSLAFRITYRGKGRTLLDEEVSVMHERVRELMAGSFNAQLR